MKLKLTLSSLAGIGLSLAITPTTIIKGKSYILWVKDADGNSDTIYAVVHRGNSRFAFLDFKYVRMTAPGLSVCMR